MTEQTPSESDLWHQALWSLAEAHDGLSDAAIAFGRLVDLMPASDLAREILEFKSLINDSLMALERKGPLLAARLKQVEGEEA